MNRGMLGYLAVFGLLIAASLLFANTDQITPAIVHAEARQEMGELTAQALEKGLSTLTKLLLGAVVAGVAAAAFAEFRKTYKSWQRNSRVRRWAAGPNAQWRNQPAVPKLRREDLMLLALSGRMPAEGTRSSPRHGAMRPLDDEEELELEMPS